MARPLSFGFSVAVYHVTSRESACEDIEEGV